MKTIHYTKSALESEKALYEHYLSSCDDYEDGEQIQLTIDALDEALRCGKGLDGSSDVTFVMDSLNFINESNARPIKINDCDIGLNTLKNS
jgi:hypothetical protein